MERKTITYNDFKEIGKKNEYFLWHFLQRNQEKNNMTFYSIFKEHDHFITNELNKILPFLNISYYESYVDEHIDFLVSSGINGKIWEAPLRNSTVGPNFLFKPVILLFKGYTFKSSTFQTCYCPEGLVELLGKENPELLSGF
jgi:hypothetical protein